MGKMLEVFIRRLNPIPRKIGAGTSKLGLVPPIRIERTTRGLGIVSGHTLDNLTSQETTNQDSTDMAPDGAKLSCPASSVVANSREEEQA